MSPVTRRVLDFLANPASYAHKPAQVTMVQTHASWVFIAPPFVFKIKKPVNLGFLDFSSLDLRREDCEREVTLNRRLAPDVYLGIEPIREKDGAPAFGDDGEIIEWCVKMRQLDEHKFLSHRLREGDVTTGDIDRIVGCLCSFYAAQPPAPPAEVATATERMKRATEDNFAIAADWIGRSLDPASFAAITEFTREFLQRRTALFEARIRGGWIRDCHGDLHSEHIHLDEVQVRIYDCIEFNTRFRYIDVAADVAFLAMDLDFNARPDLSLHLVNRIAPLLHDDGMRALMDFYKCYRACVRAKVESLHSAAEAVEEAERSECLARARRYFRLALRYAVAGSKPCAFVFMGRVASGKSSLATDFAHLLGWPIISSDALRKSLAGVPLTQRGTEDERARLYAPDMTVKTYAAMFDEAGAAIGGPHHGVVLDATFSRMSQRSDLCKVAAARGFDLIWIEAVVSDEVARARLHARRDDTTVISDARLDDFAKLGASFEPADEISARLIVNNEGAVQDVTEHLLVQLAEHRATA